MAKDLAELTLREATGRGFGPIVVQTQLGAGRRASATRGEPREARAALEEAAALAKQIGLLREELEARERLSALLRQDGQTKPAFSEMEAASAGCGCGLPPCQASADAVLRTDQRCIERQYRWTVARTAVLVNNY